MTSLMNRREFVAASAAVAVGMISCLSRGNDSPATAPSRPLRYKIAACDWMMLKRQTPGAITRAKECGLDGVETDMGPLSKNPTFQSRLSDPKFRQDYLDSCKASGIEISSLAMSGFYAQSFPEREIERPIADCIETCRQMGVKVAFLPLGVQGDIVKRPELRPTVIERLKLVAPRAEKAGITLGIETALDAAGDVQLLSDIGSPAIRIYFNFSNAIQNGRDLQAELCTLGKDRICQIHCTNQDGAWLQDDPKIDMPATKKTLDEMGWSGWLVIERSRQEGHGRDVVYNFSANAKYLKSIFQA